MHLVNGSLVNPYMHYLHGVRRTNALPIADALLRVSPFDSYIDRSSTRPSGNTQERGGRSVRRSTQALSKDGSRRLSLVYMRSMRVPGVWRGYSARRETSVAVAQRDQVWLHV